jgi:Ca2+/Na+ antiporter
MDLNNNCLWNTNSSAIIDPYFITYCLFPENEIIGFTLTVVYLMVCFLFLGILTSEYNGPNVSTISTLCCLSEEVSAATLEAVSNSLTHIIGNVISQIETKDISLSLGECLGSGMILSIFLLGCISITARDRIINICLLLREFGFYAIALLIFWIFQFGEFHWWKSVTFMSIYCVYTISIMLSLHYTNDVKNQDIEKADEKQTDRSMKSCTTDNQLKLQHLAKIFGKRYIKRRLKCSSLENAYLLGKAIDEQMPVNNENFKISDENCSICRKFLKDEKFQKNSFLTILSHYFPFIRLWSVNDFVGKIIVILCIIPNLILSTTVTTIELDDSRVENMEETKKWTHRWITAFQMAFLPVLFTAVMKKYVSKSFFSVPTIIAGIVIGIFTLFFFLVSTSENRPKCIALFSFSGFISGTLWGYLVTYEVITLLQFLGDCFQVSNIIMGLVVLNFGNNIADILSNINLAKRGKHVMALSASIGIPAVDLIFTFGIANILLDGKIKVDLITRPTLLIIELFLVGNVVYLSWKRRLSSFHGCFLVLLYFIFSTILIAMSLGYKISL